MHYSEPVSCSSWFPIEVHTHIGAIVRVGIAIASVEVSYLRRYTSEASKICRPLSHKPQNLNPEPRKGLTAAVELPIHDCT